MLSELFKSRRPSSVVRGRGLGAGMQKQHIQLLTGNANTELERAELDPPYVPRLATEDDDSNFGEQ